MLCARGWCQSAELRTRSSDANERRRAGARWRGRLLAFLHADTMPSDRACLSRARDGSRLGRHEPSWGRFQRKICPGAIWHFGLIERLINLRSRSHIAIATGDQLLFVSRELFESVGGFADIPLMEDIETLPSDCVCVQSPICCVQTVCSSSRRWEQRGILRTIGLMWRLRAAYFAGVSQLRSCHRRYYGDDRSIRATSWSLA